MDAEVWSDIVCPWCYIGQRRLQAVLRAEGRTDIVLVGRSFELDPRAARDPGRTLPELLAERYRMSLGEAEIANARVTEMAAIEGLEYHLDRARPGNTFDAHRVLQFATTVGHRAEVEERFMRGYFTEGEAIGDPTVVRRLAVEAGLDGAGVDRVLSTEAYATDVRRDEERARSLGARGVPYFRFPGGAALSGAQPVGVFRAVVRQVPADGAVLG